MRSNLTKLETIILKMLIAKSVEDDNTDSLPIANDKEITGEEARLKWVEDYLATNDS